MSKLPPIKSPLRYPGGKSRALKQILPIVPKFKEFREPMVGGGSVFFALKQLFPKSIFWINDVNEELYLLWKYCNEDINRLIEGIKELKGKYKDGRELHSYLINTETKKFSEFQRAVRFFILNRITFSGLAESGGYSEQAFKTRFTDSSIERLKKASEVLQDTKITNEPYEYILNEKGRDVLIFLDPPYYSTTKSKLYGKKGKLHEEFNHEKFAETMKNCKHNWLITYDDSEKILELFDYPGIFIYHWKLQYGMNNYKQDSAKKGKELFISNFKIHSLENAGGNKNEVI